MAKKKTKKTAKKNKTAKNTIKEKTVKNKPAGTAKKEDSKKSFSQTIMDLLREFNTNK